VVVCYLAAEAEAIALARAEALGSAGEDDLLIAEELAGASKGTRFMGMLVMIDEEALESSTPTLYYYRISDTAGAETVAIAAQFVPVVVPGTYIGPTGDLFTEVSPGILEYQGLNTFRGIVRARVSVRKAAAGIVVVHGGVMIGNPLTGAFEGGDQTISVDDGLFQQINSDAVVTFSPDLPRTRIAIALANDTNADALQALSAELTIERT
jgi:hypothetical protein